MRGSQGHLPLFASFNGVSTSTKTYERAIWKWRAARPLTPPEAWPRDSLSRIKWLHALLSRLHVEIAHDGMVELLERLTAYEGCISRTATSCRSVYVKK